MGGIESVLAIGGSIWAKDEVAAIMSMIASKLIRLI
jgi:hypothetical protein